MQLEERVTVRKTWIKLKRGLLDPRHVKAIGPAVWIFALIIDQADWSTGIVSGWTDSCAAQELGIKTNTARDWRQRLERYGYISCRQVGQALEIQIHNWTNPREYSGEVSSRSETRPADVGDAWDADKGDVQTSPLEDKGSVEGDVSGDVLTSPLPLSSQNHISHGPENVHIMHWSMVLDGLRDHMKRSAFDTWLASTTAISLENSVLRIATANEYTRRWLIANVQNKAEVLLAQLMGQYIHVEFVVGEAPDGRSG